MVTRKPVVAGQFYPGNKQECIDEIQGFLADIKFTEPLPERITAGIVPHAGWAFSGELACMVYAAIKKQNKSVDTFVIFGASHHYFGALPAVYNTGKWLTPMGEINIDEELANKVILTEMAIGNTEVHRREHSIEVQVPMIQYLFPDAGILPIITSPSVQSIELGEAIGKIIRKETKKQIVCIGSTDLTHYGPGYGFEPVGVGHEAVQWASKVNDKKFVDAALDMDAKRLLHTAAENCNACGPGAAAAAVSAAKIFAIQNGTLLAQTNSNEIMANKMGMTSHESVGYAAIVF